MNRTAFISDISLSLLVKVNGRTASIIARSIAETSEGIDLLSGR
nr:hypothetical protein [Leptolyngbya sp. 7M]